MFFVNFKNVLKGTFLKTQLGYFKVREGGLVQIANIETNRDKKKLAVPFKVTVADTLFFYIKTSNYWRKVLLSGILDNIVSLISNDLNDAVLLQSSM